jgi:hypothetical protein
LEFNPKGLRVPEAQRSESSNDLRLSGRPRVQPSRDEPFGGRSAPTAG